MSGPNPPEPGASGSDLPDQPGKHSAPEEPTEVAGADADGGETEFYSQAYSAPESEQFTSGPYVPSDVALYDYDDYDASTELVDTAPPPRWPWVVGVTAIIAAGRPGGFGGRPGHPGRRHLPTWRPRGRVPPRRRRRCRTRSRRRLRHRPLRHLRRSEELPPPPPPETVTVTEPPPPPPAPSSEAPAAGPEHHDGAADHHHDACRTPPGHLFGDGHQGPG